MSSKSSIVSCRKYVLTDEELQAELEKMSVAEAMALIRNTERDLMVQLGIFKRDIFEDACVISPCLFPFAVSDIHQFSIAAAGLKLAALISSVATVCR